MSVILQDPVYTEGFSNFLLHGRGPTINVVLIVSKDSEIHSKTKVVISLRLEREK